MIGAYKRILIIGAYITGITLLPELKGGEFNGENWMQNFMAGFFLVLSFFKLLNNKGFAERSSTYDINAKNGLAGAIYMHFLSWGWVSYLLEFNSLLTNATTFAVMRISIIGMLQNVLNKRKIKCACLGAVFNLPMSTVTIIEDGLMIAMSLFMIIKLL